MTEIAEAIVVLTDAVNSLTAVVVGLVFACTPWIGGYLREIRDALRS